MSLLRRIEDIQIIFSFSQWKSCLSLLFTVDAVVMFIIGLWLYIILNNTILINSYVSADVNQYGSVTNQLNSASITSEQKASLQAQQASLLDSINKQLNTVDKRFQLIYNYNLIFIGYFIKSLFQVINFKRANKVMPNQVKIMLVIDSINSFMILYTLIRYYTYYKADNNSTTNQSMNRAIHDQFLNIMISLSFTILSQCIRILLFIRATKELGYLLEIIRIVMFRILRFGVIYFIVMVIFITMGRILFFDVPDYSTYTNCSTTLFNASLGQFDLTVFNGNYLLSKYYGYVFLVTYIFISNIVLLNFLIAVLSSIYSNLKQRSSGLYLKHIVQVHHTYNITSKYTCFSFVYVPFTFVMLIISPLFLFKCKKYINDILIHIYYIPVMCFATLFFLLFSLTLVPIAYCSVVISKIRALFLLVRPLWQQLLLSTLSITFGFFILILVCFGDTIEFIISLYTAKPKLKNPPHPDDGLVEKIYEICGEKALRYIFKIIEKNAEKQKHINSIQLIKDIRKEFKIFEQIKIILYASPDANLGITGMFRRVQKKNGKKLEPLKEMEWEHKSDQEFSNSESSENSNVDENLNEILKEKPENILKLYNCIKKFILRNSIDIKMDSFNKKEVIRKECVSLNHSLQNIDEIREQLRPKYQLNTRVLLKVMKESIKKDKIKSILKQKYIFSYHKPSSNIQETKEEIFLKESQTISTVFSGSYPIKYRSNMNNFSLGVNVLPFCNQI